MNKFIEEQLQKCKVAEVEAVSDVEFHIKQKKSTEQIFQLNNYYILELADYIIHPNENFTLASNWNKGIVPQSKYLQCMITQILGKMIKVDGCGYSLDDSAFNNDTYLGLWLPMGGIKIIKELK